MDESHTGGDEWLLLMKYEDGGANSERCCWGSLGSSLDYFSFSFPFAKQFKNGQIGKDLMQVYCLQAAVITSTLPPKPHLQVLSLASDVSRLPSSALPENLQWEQPQPTPVKCPCPKQAQLQAMGDGLPCGICKWWSLHWWQNWISWVPELLKLERVLEKNFSSILIQKESLSPTPCSKQKDLFNFGHWPRNPTSSNIQMYSQSPASVPLGTHWRRNGLDLLSLAVFYAWLKAEEN